MCIEIFIIQFESTNKSNTGITKHLHERQKKTNYSNTNLLYVLLVLTYSPPGGCEAVKLGRGFETIGQVG